MSDRPSTRRLAAAFTGRISVKFNIGDFMKIGRENPNSVEIGRKFSAFSIKT
jgi:hypothetical protein